MSLQTVFEEYRSWFHGTYLKRLAEEEEEDVADLEWSDPYIGLKPMSESQVATLENAFGSLPQAYKDLILCLGVGPLLIADQEEPVEFTILSSDDIPKAKQDCLSWIDKDLLANAKEREGIDGNKVMPILVDRDWNQWALLANQSPEDDRVLLFSHEQEQGSDLELFAPQGTVEAYFSALLANAKKLRSPWYMWTGWER